jgi:hypothetical protein
MDPNDEILIQKYIPLSEARKDYNVEGFSFKDKEVSEWALAFAISQFKVGDRVKVADFEEKVLEGVMQQILDDMCDRGLIRCSWSEEKGELVYQITPSGIEHAKANGLV